MKACSIIVTASIWSLLGVSNRAMSDPGDLLFKLEPQSGSLGHGRFGDAVGVSGQRAVDGAWKDDANGGRDAGSAFLFDSATGIQLQKITPDDGGRERRFGISTAIHGSRFIVGQSRSLNGTSAAGKAYVFDSLKGEQLDDHAGHSGDDYGKCVAISDSYYVVGAPDADNNGTGSGFIEVFLIDSGQGMRLFSSDIAPGDRFGTSVGVSGAVAVVGAPGKSPSGVDSGAAYIFDLDTGEQQCQLIPSDGASSQDFGRSVATNGLIAIVGSPGDSTNGTSSGTAYLFDVSTGQELRKLIPEDNAQGDRFGESVAISDNVCIIGARSDDEFGDAAGSAYMFANSTGILLAKLLPTGDASGDQFGAAVGIDEYIAVVGAPNDDNGFDQYSGSAYLFDALYCPLDMNEDGITNTADLGILIAFFGTVDPSLAKTDINGDGFVDTADLGILISQFGNTCP